MAYTPHDTPFVKVGDYPRLRPTVDPVTAEGAVSIGDIHDPTASSAPGVSPPSTASIGGLGQGIQRVDVDSARDDHECGAIGEVKIAVVVDIAPTVLMLPSGERPSAVVTGSLK